MFSGSFGVRSIVLCKCSGKYIDIYFKLKITFMNCYGEESFDARETSSDTFFLAK